MSNIIDLIESEGIRKDLPDFKVGDTVKVFVKVVEGNRERTQGFEGTVIARKNGSIRETFTVRRLSFGIGVERLAMELCETDNVRDVVAFPKNLRAVEPMSECPSPVPQEDLDVLGIEIKKNDQEGNR